MEEIFYPNELTDEEIKELSGWKLHASVLHFGKGRNDCVTGEYGYVFKKQNAFSEHPSIHAVLKGRKGLEYYDLSDEIDWDTDSLLIECDINPVDLFRKRIQEQVNKWRERNESTK